MATLGSVYHDFPVLAKQSGFYFQLHTGRVNWSEIENLNIDEIVEKKNFKLLEQNLINVINCNLEREYDLKILDQNFVKLFKLAQLGVDYLSYCEMYLDKCVVLLQEQLATFQEVNKTFKQETQKKKEEISKRIRKNKTSSYQCEKCDKIFISDVYLKFHDKRRHSISNTPKSVDISPKKFTDNYQQTENGRKLSISTQTLDVIEEKKICQECANRTTMAVEHTIKIESLEQELKDLKNNLKKGENTSSEKSEPAQPNLSNVWYPNNFPNPKCCNSMLMLLPSYLSQPTRGHCEINQGCPIPFPDIHQTNNASLLRVSLETLESKSLPETKNQCSSKVEKEKLHEPEKKKDKYINENIKNIQQSPQKVIEILECDKENIDPNIEQNILTNAAKPLPPPRKLKKGIQMQSLTTDKKTFPISVEKSITTDKKVETSPISEKDGSKQKHDTIIHASTPIKGEDKSEVNLTESLPSKNASLDDHKFETIFTPIPQSVVHESKKNIEENCPKIWKLSKNIKRSLTNLYDSVSSNEKELKKRELSATSLRNVVVSGLNNRLRELGVDPEWKGIPKKTMRNNLNFLKYRRKLFSKENPLYPVIHQNMEESIFQNVKKKLGKKINKLHKQGSTDIEDITSHDVLPEETSDFVKVKNCAMYNYQSDSKSKASDSESNFIQNIEEETFQKPIITLEEFSSSEESEENVDIKSKKEFNLSVFQIGKERFSSLNTNTPRKHNPCGKEQEIFSDSDSFLEDSDKKTLEGLNGHLNGCCKTQHVAETNQSTSTKHQLKPSHTEKANQENHIIPKEEAFQSGMSVFERKKVLFAHYSDDIDELSDSPLDDDLWPFKNYCGRSES